MFFDLEPDASRVLGEKDILMIATSDFPRLRGEA